MTLQTICFAEGKGKLMPSSTVAKAICIHMNLFAERDRVPHPRSILNLPRSYDECAWYRRNSDCDSASSGGCSRFTSHTFQEVKLNISTPWDGVSRIIGGEETMPREYPSLVWTAYGIRSDGSYYFQNGGLIINENWILTTTRYFESEFINGSFKLKVEETQVTAGDHWRNETEGTEQTRNVTAFVIHPKAKMFLAAFSLLMLKVDRPFEFNEYVQPAILPKEAEPDTPEGQNYTTRLYDHVGWDTTVPNWANTPLSNIVRRIRIPATSQSYCQNYGNSPEPDFVVEHNVCTKDPNKQKDTCWSDGGPVYRIREDGVHEAVLMHYEGGCKEKGSMVGFNVRIHDFIEWIRDVSSN